MDNHLHILLRIRPDIAHAWSDQEVARRRVALLPDQRRRRLLGAAPGTAATAEELASILNCPARIAKARRDVCNLGFFHRLLKEPCARRWNHEDGVTGHFWEGRFKSPRILNQRALLLVSAYIELNEVHACKAGSIQSSFWTSARRQWQRLCAAVRHACDSESCEGVDAATVLRGATWQPVFPCKVGAINCDMPPATSQLHEAAQPEMIPLVEYLEAVDSAGRRTRTDKAGFIGPTQPRPVAMAIAKALESLRFGAPLSVRAAERLAAARMEEWIDQRAQQRFDSILNIAKRSAPCHLLSAAAGAATETAIHYFRKQLAAALGGFRPSPYSAAPSSAMHNPNRRQPTGSPIARSVS